MIVVDDLRWDDIACMGHPFVVTPNIDRIAAEGALFTNAFCTTPLCSPVRGSILTGQYPHTNGIIDNTNRSARSHELITFPRLLQDAGYRSAFVGKWHMGNDSSRRPGFDHWACLKGQGQAYNPELTGTSGKTRKVEGYITDILTASGVYFIEKSTALVPDKPFVLYLAHKALVPDLHQADDGSVSRIGSGERIPAKRHENLYTDAVIPRRPNVHDDLSGKPALTRHTPGMPPLSPETGTSDRVIIDRLRMLAAIDEGVGRLYEALEKTGALEKTLFLFTSDHGYFYGEHGLSTERRLAYEETLRIPLIVRFPPLVRPGSRIGPLSLSIDLAPTLLDLADIEPDHPLHGRSLLPVLVGRAPGWRSAFLVEYYSDTEVRRIRTMGYQAVRADRYKYIHYTDLDGMDELYDLVADPFEMTNLMVDPAHAETLAVMQAELARLLEETR